jgi:predicted nucleotidyltransferase
MGSWQGEVGLPDLLLAQRRQVAQRVAGVLARHPSVASIIVFGSVATKTVDQHSDVDMLVLCQPELVPASERALLLGELGSGWIIDVTSGNALFAVGDEGGMVDDIPVSLHYQTVNWIEIVLREVLEQGAISTARLPFRPYTLPALIQRGWLLYDAQQHVAKWREQAKRYPARLKYNIVQHFAPILQEETAELVATAQRGLGPRNFLFHLNRSVDALLSVLYALNEIYDPADRRAALTVWPFLNNAPANFVPRLTAILEGPFDPEGMKQQATRYLKLVEEVMGIVRSLNR